MNKYFIIFLLSTLFCLSPLEKSHAWWDVPHMIITQIAKNQLDPKTVEKVEDLLAYFEKDFPQSGTFITASCFADDLTSIGLSGFKVWHGVLTPYSPDGYLTEKERGCIESLTCRNNLHAAIWQSIKTLKDPKASRFEKSFLLRFLLHTVGDIHQPLHCIQLYSKEFPTGDLAGHLFLISEMPYKNLHLLWDSGFGIGGKQMQRPLHQEDLNQIEHLAQMLMKAWPASELPEKDNKNILDWSQESYTLAINTAYADVASGALPSEAYLLRGKAVAMRQMALAGYRLANLLDEIFKDDEVK